MSQTTNGFTLLEVLIAAAILSLASFTLIWAFQQSQQLITKNNQELEATIVAENLLEEYKLGLIGKTGTLPWYSNWRWQAESKNTDHGQELSLTISWPKAEGENHYTITTLTGGEP